jgi:hypothetical protein
MPSILTELFLLCSVMCLMSHLRYNLEQWVLIYDYYLKKFHTYHAGEVFALNFPTNYISWRYNFQIIEESSNPRHFN